MLNDLDQLLHDVLSSLADDGSSGDVSQDVRTRGLHAVQVALVAVAEEEVDELLSAFRVVEVDVE